MNVPTNISRRAMFAGIGALASTAALAIPVAHAARPSFVKVASPSFSIPADVMAAIKEWQQANEAKKQALAAYTEYQRSLPAIMVEANVYPEAKSAYFDSTEAAMQAQFKLLNLLESYATGGAV